MRKHTPDLRAVLGCFAALGAVLCLVLMFQVTMAAGTSADQIEGETDALQGSQLHNTETMASCIELTEATLDGPPTGTVAISHTFTVTVGPIDADRPITYFWQATEQLPDSHPLLDRLTDTMQFTWHVTGSQRVTVTAVNPCLATVSDFYTITIETQTWYVYLPLALRNYVLDPYEPNDTPAQAFGPLVSGSPYIGYFPDLVDDYDYYYIDILTLEPIDIRLTVPAQLDLNLWLYHDPGEDPVDGSGNRGKGIDEALEFTPAEIDTYYILVWRAEGSHPTAAYTLVAGYD